MEQESPAPVNGPSLTEPTAQSQNPAGPSLLDPNPNEPIENPPLELEKPVKSKRKKEDKEKKPKKKKLVIAIIIAAISLLAAIGVVLYFVVFNKKEPEVVLTDIQLLTNVGAWEKQEAPTVIWDFHEDGTGQITTNKENYYDMNWIIEQEDEDEEKRVLKITTKWLYDLDDSFSFSFDRENNSFTVINLADEGESVFVPLGTQAEKAEEVENTQE